MAMMQKQSQPLLFNVTGLLTIVVSELEASAGVSALRMRSGF